MAPLINVTLPAFNEAAQLAQSVRRVLAFLSGQAQWRWEVVIADNGSTDGTRPIAEELVKEASESELDSARFAAC